MAILTQRGFKEVCTYEDMAGAIFVLFLFGALLLLVSVSKSFDHFSTLKLERELSVRQYLRCGHNRLSLHLFHDKLADQERRLRRTLLNHQYSRLLTFAFLHLSRWLLLLQPTEPSRHCLLHHGYFVVNDHCHEVL